MLRNLRCLCVFFLFLSSSFAGALSKAEDSFYMFFISDTQFPWACSSGTEVKCEDKGRASLDALSQVMWIKQKTQELGPQRVKGIVINGDLTAFGHDDELKSFNELWFRNFLGMGLRVYPGLGNHDYSNNVNDCYNNNCAARMYNYMRDFVLQSRGLSSFDYKPSKIYYKFPKNRQDHRGSLSYSWDEGPIHFVQLHNYPAYKNKWSSWNYGKAVKDSFYVESSLTWLKEDLKKAKARNKKIIINMHDVFTGFQSSQFRGLVEEFSVSGIFAGHYHETIGKLKTTYVKAPVYLSGASVYQSALVVEFKKDKMVIEAYRGRQRGEKAPPYTSSVQIFLESL